MSYEPNEDHGYTINPGSSWLSFSEAVSCIAHRYLACPKLIFKRNGKELDLAKINVSADAEGTIYIDFIEKGNEE